MRKGCGVHMVGDPARPTHTTLLSSCRSAHGALQRSQVGGGHERFGGRDERSKFESSSVIMSIRGRALTSVSAWFSLCEVHSHP